MSEYPIPCEESDKHNPEVEMPKRWWKKKLRENGVRNIMSPNNPHSSIRAVAMEYLALFPNKACEKITANRANMIIRHMANRLRISRDLAYEMFMELHGNQTKVQN